MTNILQLARNIEPCQRNWDTSVEIPAEHVDYVVQACTSVPTKQNKNIYVLDSLSSLCSNDICEYTLDNKSLYRDNDHLSNYGSRNFIGPTLLDLINKILSQS